ncbi:hypothetical protein NSZ01_36100 [Nocardioides szechwanensis]|uniref:Uncharacterized protein n=1 Tax=Nocardioides szechwanensis TaxID=1005944 RepID=A0A1G9ZVX5_9ACTN|nr:hypothetical protein [Nocardioides szechwanensis]GEP35842.1 hypothetical protein NSZ01_36100 [Nocardioides szechwanensis]SDN25388.1 hypothetical protein SAMN05192576_1855 [Nocardioides szechwanensis]
MTAAVTYARILDGETLWLAVPATAGETLSVRGPAGEQPLPTEHVDGLAVARARLAPLIDGVDDSRVALTFALGGETLTYDGGPPPGPTKVPPTRDGRWQWRVLSADSELRVTRVATEPVVRVLSVTSDDDGVLLRLDVDAGELVTLGNDEQVLGSVAVAADGAARPELPAGRLAVRRDAATLPVVRRERDLKRPNAAVALPQVADGCRLQWQPDGRLVIAPPSTGPVDP